MSTTLLCPSQPWLACRGVYHCLRHILRECPDYQPHDTDGGRGATLLSPPSPTTIAPPTLSCCKEPALTVPGLRARPFIASSDMQAMLRIGMAIGSCWRDGLTGKARQGVTWPGTLCVPVGPEAMDRVSTSEYVLIYDVFLRII
jgi:hypothetical protein